MLEVSSSVPLLSFNRKEWASLHKNTVLNLSKSEIISLKKINYNLSINEIIEIYLPLSEFINSHISSNIKKQKTLKQFLSTPTQYFPYIIGITGSVAVGKSTTAKILQMLLSKWPKYRIVELVTTDGFLYSNKILKKRNLIQKKGFPQTYDYGNLTNFILKIKSGVATITAPIYSHTVYDIISNVRQIIYKPDILILEGLNILQTCHNNYDNSPCNCISNFIDFSIYIDAPEYLLQEWYINRFLNFCDTNFCHPDSHFYRYSQLSKKNINFVASQLWMKVNKHNLQKNILPTKAHANLILKKDINHIIDNIYLQKF